MYIADVDNTRHESSLSNVYIFIPKLIIELLNMELKAYTIIMYTLRNNY